MFQRFAHRGFHYLLLAVVWAVLCLPNLGAPALWDVDEGKNAACANAMYESDNWIVPTFNDQPRYDKPALLYWLQVAAYHALGVNEFTARLPSALAALVAVLATYELGRRAFHVRIGLLAGVIAASTAGFCAAAHFANPDALLNACTVLTLLLFFTGYRRGGGWWNVATGVTTALGVLAKGPVGLVLPTAVLLSFLVWERQLRRLWDWRFLVGVLAFLAIAAPWYIWVGLETKGQWLWEFFYNQNVERARRPLENHGGPIFYYVLMLNLGFLPWSVFLGMTVWNASRESSLSLGTTICSALWELRGGRRKSRGIWSFFRPMWAALACFLPDRAANSQQSAVRFLVCWFGVYFVFFSLVGTKLPNYILPLYPAVAVLMARVLDRYRRGEIRVPAWSLGLSFGVLALVGVGVAMSALFAGGTMQRLSGRDLPGVEVLAAAGVFPLAGAAFAWWYARRDQRAKLLGATAVTAVLFTGVLAAWGPVVVDRAKAPRELVRLLPADQTARDTRVGTYDYFQPSLVFYCQREVATFKDCREVQDFLDGPLPSYLILPADQWDTLRPQLHGRFRALGQKYDHYEGREIVVVTNVAEQFLSGR
jgi:4-amino-4-deoxy-L-arabinose transferase-like glycosyltransferase